MYSYAIVFATGLLGIWKAVPVGFALGLNPLWIYALTTLGATVAVLILYFFGEQLRRIIYRGKDKNPSKKESRVRRLLEKYGTAGLGFFGTFLIGPNATILIGLIVVPSRKLLLLWTIAGIIFWTMALTFLAFSGIEVYKLIQ
ncbi:MAG: small multi-drug export protein [Bacteroidetes bacterium]|nr:small multi-drug export protein [Bacteroidota bacterium]